MQYLKSILATIGGIVVLSVLISSAVAGVSAEKSVADEGATDRHVAEGYQISAITLPKTLNFAGESVPLNDPDIRERVDREFLVNTYWQSNALLLLKRAHKYFPVIEYILKKNGVPDDFKYLALAESGLQNVVSSAGATGFWQIMKGTGKEYGLEINENVDERYYLEKSTLVACNYLKKWKAHFGSWTLAAAAYNAGPAGIQKYMDIQKTDNYYDLLLNRETGRYIFRILALKTIMSNPYAYGFEVKRKDLYSAVPTFIVVVDKPIASWADFAKHYGISYKVLKKHNPWLREPHLNNASRKRYLVQIPKKGYYRSLR